MRKVFFAGLVAAAVWVVVSLAIRLLDTANDWAVAGGYFTALALVSVLSGLMYRLWRRL